MHLNIPLYTMLLLTITAGLDLAYNTLSAQIPVDSLEGDYRFAGNLFDSSGHDLHIAEASGAFTTDRFGRTNNAWLLDGTTDSLVIPIPQFGTIAGDFTISLWYQTNSPQIMNVLSIKDAYADSIRNFELQLNSNNSDLLEILPILWYQTYIYWDGTGAAGNALGEGTAGVFTKGNWCHLLIMRNNDSLMVYRNNNWYVPSLYSPCTGILGDREAIIISAGPHRFQGAIDDLRFYSRALTPVEIEQLWFEQQPIHWMSPLPTDAYVHGSELLVQWQYNDAALGDSIWVEASINGGAFSALPHSGNTWENALYYILDHPPGTEIVFRVTDRSDTTIRSVSGVCTVSPYDWVEVAPELPFTARDGSGLLSFKDKMWLIGGWDPPNHPPNYTHSEIWSSSDGNAWTLETIAPWPPRHVSAWMVKDEAIWVMGGDPQSGFITDVWRSYDGIVWEQVLDSIPGYAQRHQVNYAVANNHFYLFGGSTPSNTALNDVWMSSDGATWTALPDAPWSGRGMQLNECVDDSGCMWMLGGSNEYDRRSFNEVWRSCDGLSWEKILDAAPWTGRYWHTVAWYDDHMWLMAGGATGTEMGDVWYSPDGIRWKELKSTTGNAPTGTRHAQSTTVFQNALWYMCGINTNNAWKIINTLKTSINEPDKQLAMHVQVYPNPSNNKIILEIPEYMSAGNFMIIDALGAVVVSGTYTIPIAEIDIHQLPAGLYTIYLPEVWARVRFVKY